LKYPSAFPLEEKLCAAFPIRRDCENIIFRFHAPARPIALVAIFTPTSAPLRERVGPYNLHQKCQMYRLSQNAGKATALWFENVLERHGN